MKVKLLWCLALALCFAAGCSTTPHWKQEGKTQAEMERDYKECYALTRDRYGSDLQSPPFTTDLNQCMEKKGYRRDD
jgi:hypothetical protein